MSAKCPYCNKRPRGKLAEANAARYAPYCSFHCQEWANLHRAFANVRTLRTEREREATTDAAPDATREKE